VLVVTRLDRLARSTLHLCQIDEKLELKKVNLQVLDQNIDTGDTTGRLLFNMLGAIAQFETEIRAERQMRWHQKSHGTGCCVWSQEEAEQRWCCNATAKTG